MKELLHFVRVLQALEAALSSARLEEDNAVDQSVSGSESPEDKRAFKEPFAHQQ